jgi:hypothetical protein
VQAAMKRCEPRVWDYPVPLSRRARKHEDRPAIDGLS